MADIASSTAELPSQDFSKANSIRYIQHLMAARAA